MNKIDPTKLKKPSAADLAIIEALNEAIDKVGELKGDTQELYQRQDSIIADMEPVQQPDTVDRAREPIKVQAVSKADVHEKQMREMAYLKEQRKREKARTLLDTCPECGGSGIKPDGRCNSRHGRSSFSTCEKPNEVRCGRCGLPVHPCPTCNGTGKKPEEDPVEPWPNGCPMCHQPYPPDPNLVTHKKCCAVCEHDPIGRTPKTPFNYVGPPLCFKQYEVPRLGEQMTCNGKDFQLKKELANA